MLPRRHRLNRPEEFRAVVRSGARAGGRHLVVQLRASTTPVAGCDGAASPARVGFVVGRSVGPAVTRNRVSRRLRAHVAARLPDLPGGVDIVVRALPSAADAPYAELASDVDRCLDRALVKLSRRPGKAARRVP